MVTYEELADMKAIGPRPAQIKALLAERPMSARELAEALKITIGAVRPHLRTLSARDADIDKTRMGRNVVYFLRSQREKVKTK